MSSFASGFNDNIFSVHIVGPYQVTLFRDPNYSGFSQTFTGENTNLLNQGISNTASSAQVTVSNCNASAQGVTIWGGPNDNGACATLTSSLADLGQVGLNDSVYSVSIHGPYQAILYLDPNFSGPSITVSFDQPNLTNSRISGNASSIKISTISCDPSSGGVTLYANKNYDGICETLTSSVSSLDSNFNDGVYSVQLTGGYTGALFLDPGYSGTSQLVTSSIADLSGYEIHGNTSSVQVSAPTAPPTATPTVTTILTSTATATGSVPVSTVFPQFGTGQDGDVVLSQNTDLNPVRATASGPAGSSTLAIGGVTGGGFAANQLVIIQQSQGSAVGRWEFNRVKNVGSGQLTLFTPLTNTYTTVLGASAAQVLWVPQYRNVTIATGGSVFSSGWDGHTGGILAFFASGTTTVSGTLVVNGANGTDVNDNSEPGSQGGFRGGKTLEGGIGGQGEGTVGDRTALGYTINGSSSPNGNGGGGGDPGNDGGRSAAGGGGGNGASGTAGTSQTGGTGGSGGGTAGSTDLSAMVFGGGGGGGGGARGGDQGSGANGAGIIVISTQDLEVTGAINSNGGNGGSGGGFDGGGGGAGGSILLNVQTANLGNGLITANGGAGGTGTVAPGGVGGNGRIHIQYGSLPSGYTNPAADSVASTATPTSTPTATSTPSATSTNTATRSPTATATIVLPPGGVQLLPQPWQLRGNNGAAELYQNIDPNVLQGKDTLQVSLNLHGLSALGADASALIFDQGGNWHYVSLSGYVQNGLDGLQTVTIPLASFPGLNVSAPVGTLHTRFWSSGSFVVDITSIVVYAGQQATATPTRTMPTNTAVPSSTRTPSPTMTSTPRPSSTPPATASPTATQAGGVELLSQPWHLQGNNGAAELYQSIAPSVLQGKSMLRITYNLHSLRALGGDASAIIFDQNGWQYISLANYGTNGLNGSQVVTIPLANFMALNPNQPVTMVHTRFWYSGPFTVDVTSIVVY